jgi:NDP-sugar pyrophosphorylase family protein
MGRRCSFVSECVILAGGVGSRLGTHTGNLPKTLIPVAGRPFADYQLTWLAKQGVGKVVYCIGYRGDQIRDYVGEGDRWGLNVTYVDEGLDLRGTGGALRLALDERELAECFGVLYGDSYLRVDIPVIFAAFHRSGRPALMTVLRNNGRWDRSNADFDGRLVTRYSKDDGDFKWIDYGLTVLDRDVVSRIPQGQSADLVPLYSELSSERLLAGFEVTERFYEIGSLEGLSDLERALNLGLV